MGSAIFCGGQKKKKKQFLKSGSGRRDAGMLSKNNAVSSSARKTSTSSPGGRDASSFQGGRFDNLATLGNPETVFCQGTLAPGNNSKLPTLLRVSRLAV